MLGAQISLPLISDHKHNWTPVMPVCHLLYCHWKKRWQIITKQDHVMVQPNTETTRIQIVQGLCMLNIRSLQLCTSNSSVYKLDQVSVSSHRVCIHLTSQYDENGSGHLLGCPGACIWAMMARISESIYLCRIRQCKNRIRCHLSVNKR